MKRVTVAAALPAALTFLTVGCSDSTEPPVPTTVLISGAEGPLTSLGETVSLSAEVQDQHGTSMPEEPVEWASLAPSVVSVSDGGTVTAEGAGQGEVEASARSARATETITVDPLPADLAASAGQDQEGTVARPLPEPLVVEVRDARGNALPGVEVGFEVEAGEGSLSSSVEATGEDGRASVEWTLGTVSGDEHAVVARAEDLSITFEAEALPDDPTEVLPETGGDQSGYAFEPFPEDPSVRLLDAFGNPVPGVEVRWEPGDSEATADPMAGESDGEGVARTTWTLGAQEGPVQLTAEADALEPVVFEAEALQNAIIEGTLGVDAGAMIASADRRARDGASPSPPDQAGAFSRTPFGLPPEGPRAERAIVPTPRSGPSAPWGAPMSGSEGSGFRPGELLVTYARPALDAAALPAEALRAPGAAEAASQELRALAALSPLATRFRVTGASPVLRTVRVEVAPGEGLEQVAAALRREPGVARVSRNAVVRGFQSTGDEPADPLSDLSPMHPVQAWHYESIGLGQAWKLERGSSEVVVAIVDDGVRFDHPWLEDRWVSQGYSFVPEYDLPVCDGGTVSSTGNGMGPGPDATVPISYVWNSQSQCVAAMWEQAGHGLHVAGIVAALDGGGLGSGIAPGVRLLPVRVLGAHGAGSMYDVAQGVLYAAGLPADGGNGEMVTAEMPARVINLSLGGSSADSLLAETVEEAHRQGALLVAAAGNHGGLPLDYPAAYPEVIAVGAVDPALQRAPYSARGSDLELVAPGGSGPSHSAGVVWSSEWNFQSEEPAIGGRQGTSTAAPHVAGAAALLWSQDPGLGNDEVRALLLDHARPLGSGSPNASYGYGLVDIFQTLTRGEGLPGGRRAVLYDAASGEALGVRDLGGAGDFRFDRLEDGRFWVFGGMDELGDGAFGIPPRPWNASGGAPRPSAVEVEGSAVHNAPVELAFPLHSGNQTSSDDPDVLPLGGYLNATLSSGSDTHHYEVRIPAQGAYVFETTGWDSACGFAFGLDSVLTLLDEDGGSLASSSEIDEDRFNYCSWIEVELEPGVYRLEVTGWGAPGGWYRVVAREGG